MFFILWQILQIAGLYKIEVKVTLFCAKLSNINCQNIRPKLVNLVVSPINM